MTELKLSNIHKNTDAFYRRMVKYQLPNNLIMVIGLHIRRSDWKSLYVFLLINHVTTIAGIPSVIDILDYNKTYTDKLRKFLNFNYDDHHKLELTVKRTQKLADSIFNRVNPKLSQNYCFNVYREFSKIIEIWGPGIFHTNKDIEFIKPVYDYGLKLNKKIDNIEDSKEKMFEVYLYVSDNIETLKEIFIYAYNYLMDFNLKANDKEIFNSIRIELFTINPFHKKGTKLF